MPVIIDLGEIYVFEISNNSNVSFTDITESINELKYTGISLTPEGPWNVLFNEKRHIWCENNSSIDWDDLLNYRFTIDINKHSILRINISIDELTTSPKINLLCKSMVEYDKISAYINIVKDTTSYSIRNTVME